MTTTDTMKGMRKIIAILEKEPGRILSATDMVRERVIPWAKHTRTLLGIIKADMHGPKVLNAKVSGKGYQARYKIEASNIIKYLKEYGPVMIHMVRTRK